MTNSNRVPTRLIDEKSPYLLQHAYNPVNWYPWNEEAFAKAKAEDKPIYVSLGASNVNGYGMRGYIPGDNIMEQIAKDPALKAEFEEKMKDPAFAKDSQAILNFFYEKVKKTAHQNNELHPAWRVMDSTQIFK